MINTCYRFFTQINKLNFFPIFTIKQKHSIHLFDRQLYFIMKNLLTSKQNFLLKKITLKLKKLSQFMCNQGLSSKNAYDFIVQCIFEVQVQNIKLTKKISTDIGSQTEQQTNSEVSDYGTESLQIQLEKVMVERLKEGLQIQNILIDYLQKCSVEEEKLKNYLKSEEHNEIAKQSIFDFEKFREKIQQKKYGKSRYNSSQFANEPKIEPILSQVNSLKQQMNEVKRRALLEDTQKELDYMRSFEKSLNESIKRTRMLRSMLQKQLSSEFSPLNFPLLKGDEQLDCREQIY